MTIIGIAGYAQVGKDTAGRGLVEAGFQRFAFADVLKDEVNAMLRAVGIADDTHQELQKKFWRDFLVFWGAKRRAISPDYWIGKLEASIRSLHVNIVITDVRYLNEVKWIESLGGQVIYLSRPGYGPANEEEKQSFDAIRSSANLVEVCNDASIPGLWSKVAKLISPTGVE